MPGFFPYKYFPRETPVAEESVEFGIVYDYQTRTGEFIKCIELPLIAVDITNKIIPVVLPCD